MDNNQQLTTPAVDLVAPANRFQSSSRLYTRLHRWHVLLRRFWWLAALILVAVLGPVYIYTAATPSAYQSKARMWLAGKVNLGEGRLYTEELIDYLATQSELLRSPEIQHRALTKVRKLVPDDVSSSSPPDQRFAVSMARKAKDFVTGLIGMDSGVTNDTSEAIPFKVKVTEASKSSILELKATGPDRESTRAFLASLMDEYFAFKRENRLKASDQTLSSVNREVRQLADELKAQQQKVHAFQSSNNVVFLQEQGNSAGNYLARLNRQLSSLRTQLQLLQRLDPEQWIDVASRRTAATSDEPSDLPASEVPPNIAGPQAELYRANQQAQLLKVKRDELARFLRPEHPKIAKLNEDIATQERVVQMSRNEAMKQLGNRRQTLQLEIQNLESAFNEWDHKAVDSSRKIADYDTLRQDMQRLQSAYDRVFGLMQTVDLGKNVDQENLAVLEPASPAKKVPRMIINMLGALAAAVILSMICLYCLGIFDDRFASLSELSAYFSEEVLAQIPAISLKNAKGRMGVRFLERQRFEFLEAFRNLRSSLLYMGNGTKRPRTILITSSVPKEGKSTVALYLAATMALGNSRVLLVDADMRRSSLHRFFALRPAPGLAETLSGEVTHAQSIIPTTIENLWLLPAGVARRNPGELVLSPEWGRLMEELAPWYDYILIDSPPLLAADDAASLAPQVEGVMLVVRGAYTSARMARRALNLLRQRQSHVLGLIFNRAPSSAYEYRYYQHQEYRWRSQGPPQAPVLAYEPAQPVRTQVAR